MAVSWVPNVEVRAIVSDSGCSEFIAATAGSQYPERQARRLSGNFRPEA